MEELTLGAWEHLNLAVWKNHSRQARWLAVCNLLVALQEEGADGAAAPSKAATLIYPRYIRTFVFSAVAILKLLCWASLRKESRSLTAAEAARGSSSPGVSTEQAAGLEDVGAWWDLQQLQR